MLIILRAQRLSPGRSATIPIVYWKNSRLPRKVLGYDLAETTTLLISDREHTHASLRGKVTAFPPCVVTCGGWKLLQRGVQFWPFFLAEIILVPMSVPCGPSGPEMA